MYFEYSSHRTREAAELALEDYFATGEICEAERPYIRGGKNRKGEQRFYVMFPG